MNNFRHIYKSIILTFICMISMVAFGQEQTTAAVANDTGSMNPDTLVRYVLGTVIILFVLIIYVLSRAIRIAGDVYRKKLLETHGKGLKVAGLVLALNLISELSHAQEVAATATNNSRFSQLDIYLLFSVVILLFVVVFVLIRTLFILMGIKDAKQEALAADGVKRKTLFQRMHQTVAIEDEHQLDLDHNYDGIRELDNKVPAWWSWGFYACILWAGVYLYRMLVTGSMPGMIEELNRANEIAAVQKAEYLKKGANNVDENTVKLLDAAGITEGASLYAKNCVACHGDKGQGNSVGPNLTDNYWIHKGSLKDIFYSIKYGWAEKGMKSWKDDFSPGQIAQLSSYVYSLKGTNPAGAKEAQGELYTEMLADGSVTDSATNAANTAPADSLKK